VNNQEKKLFASTADGNSTHKMKANCLDLDVLITALHFFIDRAEIYFAGIALPHFFILTELTSANDTQNL
jgi:hypothetical protein